MTKIAALHPTLRAWLLEGPLSAQVPAYIARLWRGRYATYTCGRCLNGVAHFAHLMSMCHLPARMLNEGCIDQFFATTCLAATAWAARCAHRVRRMRRWFRCWRSCVPRA